MNRTRKHNDFKVARCTFDKTLKRVKRKFNRGLLLTIEKCNTKDPNKFWNYINKLGPTKRHVIPLKIEVDGVILTDERSVLSKWRSEFERLYAIKNSEFDDDFKNDRMNELKVLDYVSTAHPECAELNAQITLEEVKKSTEHSKDRKAVGIDNIANELLRNGVITQLLHSLFNICFEMSMIPDQWGQQ